MLTENFLSFNVDSQLISSILSYLKLPKGAPTLYYLKKLILAYCSNVPWESVSRIVKKNQCNTSSNCVRLENEFWQDTLRHGTGGTCYESNWAFFWLLQNLGFKGYLTINKIEDKNSYHSAIIVQIHNTKFIVDVGYPVYSPIQIKKSGTKITDSPFISYQSTSITSNEYLIENIPHPKPYLYHLLDSPVSKQTYLEVAKNDYSETGLFLDRIIIRKIVNHLPTRFDNEDIPFNIHTLQKGVREKEFIDSNNLFNALSNHFKVGVEIVKEAFAVLKKQTT